MSDENLMDEQASLAIEAREMLRRHWLMASIRANSPLGIETLPMEELEGILLAGGGPKIEFDKWAELMLSASLRGNPETLEGTNPSPDLTPEEIGELNKQGMAKIQMSARFEGAPVKVVPAEPKQEKPAGLPAQE
jgi:hypothetical protein